MIGQLCYLPAKEEDIPVIFAQSKALVDSYEDLTLINYPKVMEWLERKIRANIAQYTCVKLGDRNVGYYRLCFEENRVELDDFYVLPEFRNMGIGTQILKKCLCDTDMPMYLYVFTANAGAISLYRRHGFAVSDQVSATRLIMSCRT